MSLDDGHTSWCSTGLQVCGHGTSCACADKGLGHPVPILSGPELRAACEAYLRENGWTYDLLDDHPHYCWRDPVNDGYYTLSTALDIQWARDGVGGAT